MDHSIGENSRRERQVQEVEWIARSKGTPDNRITMNNQSDFIYDMLI